MAAELAHTILILVELEIDVTFFIKLLPKEKGDNCDDMSLYGMIRIGSFQERFLASISYWTQADYEEHWKKALRRILDEADKSCLISSMHIPSKANYITWWPIYRLNGIVAFQNQLLFFDRLAGPFDVTNPYSHIPPRQVVNDEAYPISEWCIPIEHVKEYYAQI
jgi:hypothetical protein